MFARETGEPRPPQKITWQAAAWIWFHRVQVWQLARTGGADGPIVGSVVVCPPLESRETSRVPVSGGWDTTRSAGREPLTIAAPVCCT